MPPDIYRVFDRTVTGNSLDLDGDNKKGAGSSGPPGAKNSTNTTAVVGRKSSVDDRKKPPVAAEDVDVEVGGSGGEGDDQIGDGASPEKKRRVHMDKSDGNMNLNCSFNCTYFSQVAGVALLFVGILLLVSDNGSLPGGILAVCCGLGLGSVGYQEQLKVKFGVGS